MSDNQDSGGSNPQTAPALPWKAPFSYDARRGVITDANGKDVCLTRVNISDEQNALIAVALSGYASLRLSTGATGSLVERLRQSVASCRMTNGGPIEAGLVRCVPLELVEEAADALASRSAITTGKKEG